MGELAVNVDDVTTWPAAAREEVEEWAGRLEGTTEYPSDLDIPWGADGAFLELLDSPLRMYHCTRLLEHEVEGIRRHGLRTLTRELVEERIDHAAAAGVISTDDAELLRRSHLFRTGEAGGRKGQVCLMLSSTALVEGDGVWPLLTTWGGEAMYMATKDTRPLLETVGRPAVVVADVDMSAPGSHAAWPGVLCTFVATRLALARRGASVHYRAPVLAAAIVDIWQPGHSAYDVLDQLPQ